MVKASPHSRVLSFRCAYQGEEIGGFAFNFILRVKEEKLRNSDRRVKEKKLRNSDRRVKEKKLVLSLWPISFEMGNYDFEPNTYEKSNVELVAMANK